MNEGIYEQLITKLIQNKLDGIDKDKYYINKNEIDKEEASLILSRHIATTIKYAFNFLSGDNKLERQIEISNKIIKLLKEELNKEEFNNDLVEVEGQILNAIFKKVDAHFSDIEKHLKEITPYTRLSHSELFTGGSIGLSLESELRKEILSSNRIDLLVSFIKFKGFRILENELNEFTKRGGILRVLTTTYMGASDYKAIQLLSKLDNTEVKISYNSGNERLHAKAYLFHRNSGFHTGYIGSSNFSRSALTDGLEWNLKITTKEVSHVIDKFQKTFESYWQNTDFEKFDDSIHKDKLIESLNKGKSSTISNYTSFFDVKPYPFQEELLEKLKIERSIHSSNKNLVVAATGTGKTVISAFDFKSFLQVNPNAKLLFIAHRKEILQQAQSVFCGVLKDNNFGELWVDGLVPNRYEHVFASIQSINNKLSDLDLTRNYYDYIIIDECHHLTASSYRGILEYFSPNILLGLTATPERMDGGDITEDFNNRIAAEIRLPEALNKKLLCPFQYFGVTDSIDLTNVTWERGRYVASELTNLYTRNDRRANEIIQALDKYTKDVNDVRALGFCVSMAHAKYMAEKFSLAGLKADYLTSDSLGDRDSIKRSLQKKEINYLFVVDIYNEGVDIPEIDTVLFLRPTESLTIFLQQLGRGLRLADDKDCLTVLDFVGNSRPEYNFENKFRALIGKTSTPVSKEIEDNFPHLPLGCSIVLERKAKENILKNITAATSLNINQLINKIRLFEQQTTLELNLKNFITVNNLSLQKIYSKGSWNELCFKAGKIEKFDDANLSKIKSAIEKKWLSTRSYSYFNFILNLAKNNFEIKISDFTNDEQTMLIMLHYDIWQQASTHDSLEKSIRAIGDNKDLVNEIVEVLEILIDSIDFEEYNIELPYHQPLKVHSRYTRDQILAAFGFSNFYQKSSNREGVANSENLNSELLFINLVKSEEDFSPTTMYEDYAISESLFHWQSQNSAGPDTPKGKSYINHKINKKNILLFIREGSKDEYKNTPGYIFLGDAIIDSHYGTQPMSIIWKLKQEIPPFLWKFGNKLGAG